MNGAMELLRAAQEGNRDACEQAVLENNGLIWSVVRRYYGRGVEPDDLYQLGCLGFLKAIRGFDFSYGTCFSTYAVPKIAGEIRRFLRDDGTIKVGRSIREQALTLYALRERLRQELGREPSLTELSDQTGWTPEEIAQVDLATEAPDSLQRETADGLALEGLLGTEAPEEGLVERIALREAVDAGRFRQDLYYRLSAFSVELPPLRDCREDIYAIANEFMEEICQRYHIPDKALSGEAFSKLLNYDWPGNLRELENVLEGAAALSDTDIIYPEHIHLDAEPVPLTLRQHMRQEERRYIQQVLVQCGGDRKLAMKQLDVSRSVFYDRLKEYGLG